MHDATSLKGRLGCFELTLPANTEVDVEQAFITQEAALRAHAVGDDTQAVRLARASTALCSNDFLPGANGHWVEKRQAEMRSLRLASLEVLAEAGLACGDLPSACQAARAIISDEPYHESAYILLMKTLAAAGNMNEAACTYQLCCDVLERELGSVPSAATQDAYLSLEVAATRSTGGARPPAPKENNLPATISTFVGRSDQIAVLESHLTSTRLLTLTGTAGVGKTRLAIELARRVAPEFPDGIFLIELATIGNSAFLQYALSVLKVPDSSGDDAAQAICHHIAHRRLLLLLDNCEHLIPECADFATRMLAAAPDVKVMATTREPLHVPGEVIWQVPPLSLPALTAGSRDADLMTSEAVQLFAERAASIAPHTELDVRAVANICVRLDGIPLAIELAAARTRVFTAPELARLLEKRLDVLENPGHGKGAARHRSLEAALDWSYQSLPVQEKHLFQRIAVFVGGFTLPSAARVSSCQDPVASLSGLVEKSLVIAESRGIPDRFRQLDTVRSYALAKLVESGDDIRVRDQYLLWACQLAEEKAQEFGGPAEEHSIRTLDEEQENMRAALDWAAESHNDQIGLRLAVALSRFWEIRGYLKEGRGWLQMLVARESTDLALKATALNAAGVLAHQQSDYEGASDLHGEALAIRRSLHDDSGVATVLNGLANVAVSRGDLVVARRLFHQILAIGRALMDNRIIAASLMNLSVVTLEAHAQQAEPPEALLDAHNWLLEALGLNHALGDLRGVAVATQNIGVLHAYSSDREAARATFQESLEVYRALGDKSGIAGTVRFLGQLSYLDGDLAAAQSLTEECRELVQDLGSTARVAESLSFLGAISERTGDISQARRLFQESLTMYARVGMLSGVDSVRRQLAELDSAFRGSGRPSG
jgi:predicted ATPase